MRTTERSVGGAGIDATRTRADACPGVVSPHLAADGALARVRLPGGAISATALRAVAALAEVAGDGAVHLTSRGNLQLRGMDPDDPRPVQRLDAAGLLPSRTHERVRNVLASPLSGITGGVADVRGLAAALDRDLCARPSLASLPGRFLFAFDDGRGDVAAERPDVCWLAVSDDDGELLVAGAPTGLWCFSADSPSLLLDAAETFLLLRAEHAEDPDARAWRAVELPDAAIRIGDALVARWGTTRAAAPTGPGRAAGPSAPTLDDSSSRVEGLDGGSSRATGPRGATPPRRTPAAAEPRRLGESSCRAEGLDESSFRATGSGGAASTARRTGSVGSSSRPEGSDRSSSRVVGVLGSGAVGAAPVLGELSVAQLRVLAELAPDVIVTPWRTLVVPAPHDPGTALDRLREADLVVDPQHAALRVSACAGTPGCAKSLADVRAHARSLVTSGADGPVHVSGCARRCGAPHGTHTDLVATGPRTYTTEEHR
ncbi:hypothetical protein [Pseudonocardia endophytica]|uniref:hypothetical protein n=1 Tax=Pseudonocardia endophytica TaxID=401976 RepID=UPI001FB4FA91|nr:hypothetical protein [Pseudonocardia endophytica]